MMISHLLSSRYLRLISLTSNMLLIQILFQGDSTRLRHVRLSDASKLTVKGLKTLKGHKIVELETLGLTKATVTDLIRYNDKIVANIFCLF